ncbi:MAG: drug/metabolite transporter (DMT)-like permease [Acidimicrobiales bacterium]
MASFVGLTEIPFAVLLAWVLLEELPRLAQLGGDLLILVGLALVQSDRADRRHPTLSAQENK